MKYLYKLGIIVILLFSIPAILFILPDGYPFDLLTIDEAITLSVFICIMCFIFYLRVKSIFIFVRPEEEEDEELCSDPIYCDEVAEMEQK